MTKPLITTINPSEGLASGRRRIVIRGMHFNVLESEAGTGDPTPTISVTFNGVEAEAVVQVARYRVDAVLPRYLGAPEDLPKTVDVVVSNLDENGDPISGEVTTATDGFTYRRPDLALNPDLRGYKTLSELVCEEFIQSLRRGIIDEVAPATDPDWSRDPSSGLTAVAQLPCILLDGPRIEESKLYRFSEPSYDAPLDPGPVLEDEYAYRVHPFTAIFSWGIVLVADRKHEAVRLLHNSVRFFDRRPYLRIPLDADESVFDEVDLFIDDWNTDDQPQNRVYSYSSTARIEPVYLYDDHGLAADGVPGGDITGHKTEDATTFLQLEEDQL